MRNLLFFSFNLFIWSSVFAENNSTNLSGTWVGKRYQFNEDKKTYHQTFTYMYELKQEGNIVKGTSYIKNEDGNYAEISIRGIVLGNKFYFEEYEIIRAERPDGKIWCFKKGELNIEQKNADYILSGETKSYTEDYGESCSGGVSYMTKLDEFGGANPTDDELGKASINSSSINITNYPNPFVESTNISIKLNKPSVITMDIIDITGKSVGVLFDGKKDAGYHNINFESSKMGISNRVLIVRLKIGNQIITKNILQQMF